MLKTLEIMCRDKDFSEEQAAALLKQTDLNQVFVSSRLPNIPYESTLLNEAAESCNFRMVKLLLQHEADPNLVYAQGECVLWDRQYPPEPEDEETNLQIAQLLLEYGANPNIMTEADPEDLFSYVAWSMFNDDPDDLWVYRGRFFVLLIAYGGSSRYARPEIVQPFDKTKMQNYHFHLVPEKDNTYSGIVVDEHRNPVAYL